MAIIFGPDVLENMRAERMGYFSNSDEGLAYEAQYCERCVHGRGESCPVMELHLLADDSNIVERDMFIPRNGNGNEKCRMFLDAPNQAPWDP